MGDVSAAQKQVLTGPLSGSSPRRSMPTRQELARRARRQWEKGDVEWGDGSRSNE
jgi:hypothetical protein